MTVQQTDGGSTSLPRFVPPYVSQQSVVEEIENVTHRFIKGLLHPLYKAPVPLLHQDDQNILDVMLRYVQFLHGLFT